VDGTVELAACRALGVAYRPSQAPAENPDRELLSTHSEQSTGDAGLDPPGVPGDTPEARALAQVAAAKGLTGSYLAASGPAVAIIVPMTRGAEARLFVAADLPADVRARLAAWARGCALSARAASSAPAGRRGTQRQPAGGRMRPLGDDTLHVTLCFLGGQPVGEVEAIREAVTAACAEAPPVGELELGAPLWLPPRRPRALAVELHDDPAHALLALRDAVAGALAAVCDVPPQRGRFRPHVTVARVRAGEAPLERGLPATPALSFIPRSVTIYRSWLTPTEALYEALDRTTVLSGAASSVRERFDPDPGGDRPCP
jgi:RNA 2',3'-cyclic 3'-phosphodiesterase